MCIDFKEAEICCHRPNLDKCDLLDPKHVDETSPKLWNIFRHAIASYVVKEKFVGDLQVDGIPLNMATCHNPVFNRINCDSRQHSGVEGLLDGSRECLNGLDMHPGCLWAQLAAS